MVPTLRAKDLEVEVDAVFFDKDGTLADLDAAWAPRGAQWIAEIERRSDRAVAAAVARAIGIAPTVPAVEPAGVLAAGTMKAAIDTIDATLRDLGYEWRRSVIKQITETGEGVLVPVGDVAGTFGRLAAAGIKIGVLTSDDRQATTSELEALALTGWVDGLSCGDDGLAPKPDPGGFLLLAEQMGVAPERVVMVGDSPSDVLTARNAKAAAVVVVDGPHTAGATRASADAVVGSVDEFIVGRP